MTGKNQTAALSRRTLCARTVALAVLSGPESASDLPVGAAPASPGRPGTVELAPATLHGYGTLAASFQILEQGRSSRTHILCETAQKALLTSGEISIGPGAAAGSDAIDGALARPACSLSPHCGSRRCRLLRAGARCMDPGSHGSAVSGSALRDNPACNGDGDRFQTARSRSHVSGSLGPVRPDLLFCAGRHAASTGGPESRPTTTPKGWSSCATMDRWASSSGPIRWSMTAPKG